MDLYSFIFFPTKIDYWLMSKTLNEIFAENSFSRNSKETIYKVSLGKTQEERKKSRAKIRRIRDRFIQDFLSAKGKEKESILANWKQFAEQIYKDTKVLCESNTGEETKDLINKFLVESAKMESK